MSDICGPGLTGHWQMGNADILAAVELLLGAAAALMAFRYHSCGAASKELDNPGAPWLYKEVVTPRI
ncbi:hypothetical protein P170DRAFT_472568 [Aspergillus steynii IBT 23096]|uniref:Uncharacterized protein n=1 Tax=Aspergillus steynii IBT 23096 TaxID=1392250 RepID=A0A2I2GIL3_9EURO|nr:uncharacterized protein P170DRAFT_472568 [Aspergillus steynii IBT 23096]PLB52677.1 hypothetical protein P170DRAFT_472568 [Aspergillus steynii IBT 23096]